MSRSRSARLSPKPPRAAVAREKIASPRKTNGYDTRLFVASVEKAMMIMEIFDNKTRALSMSEISARTRMGRSASQRFIYTLEHLGYLRRDPLTKHYSLSSKVFRFAHSMLSGNDALEMAKPLLIRLSERTRETLSWVEIDGEDIVVLGNFPGTHMAAINLPVGMRFPALSSSSGQVLLAHLPSDPVVRMFTRAHENTRVRLGFQNTAEILALLEKIRRSGYSVTEKNLEHGSVSISAPIFDRSGLPVAALNLSTLKLRHSRDSVRKVLVPLVMETAKAISSLIGR